MNTTVYWNPQKSSQNQSITYYIEFNDGQHDRWNSSRCSFLRRHKDSGVLSCLFLTCDSTQLGVYYEVRVRAGNLSNNGSVTDPILYDPSDESKFSQIIIKLFSMFIHKDQDFSFLNARDAIWDMFK